MTRKMHGRKGSIARQTSASCLLWTLLLLGMPVHADDKPAIPVPPGTCRMFESADARIYVVLCDGPSDGVFLVDAAAGKLQPLTRRPPAGAVVTFDGQLFSTREGRVWQRDLHEARPAADVTDTFGGKVAEDGDVTLTADGRVWVAGCARYRTTDGRFLPVPRAGEAKSPTLPLARDIAGNDWSLDDAEGGNRRLLVSPAQLRLPATSGRITLPTDAIPRWLASTVNHGVSPGDWRFVAADDLGLVWATTPESLWLFGLRKEPHRKKDEPPPAPNQWHQVQHKVLAGETITAMARRPLGGLLLGLATGRILEVKCADYGSWQAMQAPPGKILADERRAASGVPVRCVWTDRSGRLWAVVGDKLEIAGAAQWTGWRRRPLYPWGFMGAGSCGHGDRLFVGGALHGIYGLPASTHTGALHLMAAGPETPWSPVCRLRLGRGFTGASLWRGRLWLLCGTSIPWHGCGSTDWVETIDPHTGDLDIARRTYGWRAHAAAITWRDRLYVMGLGMKLSEYWGFMESIGVGEEKWRKEPEPPVTFSRSTQGGIYDRIPVSACLVDDVFYVLTSQHGLLAYMPAGATWRADLAQPPEKPFQGHVVAVDNEVWLVANETLHAYSPAENTWRRVVALPVKREWGFAARAGDTLTIGGGHPCNAGRRNIFASQETFSLSISGLREGGADD